jgi:hypothetical protein
LRESLATENSAEFDEVRLKGEIARREKRMEKIESAKKRIEAEAAARNETVDPKKQKSFNDLDALASFNPKKGMSYDYNVQTAVDSTAQIVVACELHDNCSDQGALVPILDKAIENVQAVPENVLGDAGFNKAENILAIEERGAVPFFAPGKGEDDVKPGVIESVTYDDDEGKWRCPEGRLLPEAKERDGRRQLALPQNFCGDCPQRNGCPLFEKQGRRASLPPEKARAAQQRNAERIRTPEGKAVYKRRKAIVEAPFGNMKNKGMRILVKGSRKVDVRIKLFALAHNVEKILGHRAKQVAA